MRSRENAVQAALLRAQRFIAENAAQLTSVVDLNAARTRLDDVIASFSTHAADQDANDRSAKGETEKQRQLRLKRVLAISSRVSSREASEIPSWSETAFVPSFERLASFLEMLLSSRKISWSHLETLLSRSRGVTTHYQVAHLGSAVSIDVHQTSKSIRKSRAVLARRSRLA